MQFIISYQHVDMLLEYAMKIDTIIISNCERNSQFIILNISY
jgi:hypothetical protein